MEAQLKPASGSDQHGSSQRREPVSSQSEQRENPPSRKNAVRKRTKTGCLTCRKRRVKCDEAKPICVNCIKSKRECDYNQRLTFKEPLGAYHHHAALFGHPVYPPHHPDPLMVAQMSAVQQQARAMTSQGNPLTVIAPKPPGIYHFEEVYPRHLHPTAPPAHVPPLNMSPVQHFSPDGMPNPPFHIAQMPAPASAHAEMRAGDFFHLPTPQLYSENVGVTTGGFAQYAAASHGAQPSVCTNPGPEYAPRPLAGGRGVQSPDSGAYRTAPDYWSTDDEASMGESDDEVEGAPGQELERMKSHQLGARVAERLQYADYYGTQVRSFRGFVDANYELETYTPTSTSSPLNDTQTAAVFWHFVNVTGPSMSLYERHPFDPSPMFQGQPVPKARQHIWTYTFPIIAFNHPALLQAMLALGSLQMAKLQGIPATASMKHYHLSLRRIAKNYQNTTRRRQSATLAATLLLGFYEVWNSDHDKWCKHMWGARAIIREIPLREMTKAVMGIKRKARQRARDQRDQCVRQRHHAQELFGHAPTGSSADEDGYEPADMTDVNAGLVSQLVGQTVTYDDFGHIYSDEGHQRSSKKYTERDVENFEHLSDLYWWYCKMDVYQSILGATKLFMEYDLWTQCAPRGPFGRIDAIYGTYDHLMLLLGRVCNFASSDLSRKRKGIQKKGSSGSSSAGNGQSPPMFAGLMPSSGRVTRPTGFSPPRESTPQSETSEEPDFDESTAAALREWDSIRQAFDIFRANLGPDFDPLGPDLVPSQETPFGLAHSYRTFSIAGLWMNYYMGLISLYRAHPSMPPIAMVAAGLAAPQTMQWAIEVGKIASGLTTEDFSMVASVSTLVGAALIESCFCMFVAGVQLLDTAQRHWTVKRLHDIARLTGWQSARQIADGCESAWTRMAQLGRGPPYQRPPEVEHVLPLFNWTKARRIDRKFAEIDGNSPAGTTGGGPDERGKFVLSRSEQSHYALGLLSVEYDLQRLELRDEA